MVALARAPSWSAGCCAKSLGAEKRVVVLQFLEGALVEHGQDGAIAFVFSAGTTTRAATACSPPSRSGSSSRRSPRSLVDFGHLCAGDAEVQTDLRRRRHRDEERAVPGRRRRQVGDHEAEGAGEAEVGRRHRHARADGGGDDVDLGRRLALPVELDIERHRLCAEVVRARADQPRRRVATRSNLRSSIRRTRPRPSRRAARRRAPRRAARRSTAGAAGRACTAGAVDRARRPPLRTGWPPGGAPPRPRRRRGGSGSRRGRGRTLLQHRPRRAPPVLAHVPAERRADVGEERGARRRRRPTRASRRCAARGR